MLTNNNPIIKYKLPENDTIQTSKDQKNTDCIINIAAARQILINKKY